MCFPAAYFWSTKIVRFLCAWVERFFKIYPSSSKFFFTPTREFVFSAAELEHWIQSMRILGALKSYDSTVHGPSDFSKFIPYLRKFLLLRQEDVFSGHGVRALKSCDAYARCTKIVRYGSCDFLKIYLLSSKNFFTPTRGCCIFRPRGWRTKMLQCIFLEHLNLKIFLCTMRQIWKYLHF